MEKISGIVSRSKTSNMCIALESHDGGTTTALSKLEISSLMTHAFRKQH